jgi:hypothetical protein
MRIESSRAQGHDSRSIVGGAAKCDSLSLDDFLEDYQPNRPRAYTVGIYFFKTTAKEDASWFDWNGFSERMESTMRAGIGGKNLSDGQCLLERRVQHQILRQVPSGGSTIAPI